MMASNFNELTALEQALQNFSMDMIGGLIRIAIILVIAGIALAKSCNQYGTSSKVMTWSIAALIAAVVLMV